MFTETAGLTQEQENEFKRYQASAESFRDFLESITAFCDDSVLLLFIQAYLVGYKHIDDPLYIIKLRNNDLIFAVDPKEESFTFVSEKEANEKGFRYGFYKRDIDRVQAELGIIFDSDLIIQVGGTVLS